MARKGDLTARIDADIARLRDIEAYAQTHGDNEALLQIINGEIIDLQKIRDYATGVVGAPTPKRTRKKKGLPAEPQGV